MPDSFTITIGTVELPAPGPATTLGPLPSHVQALSENHVVYAHQLTERDLWAYTITLENVRKQQYLDLHDFHALNGTRGLWTYTASDGSMADNCRFQDGRLDWRRESNELWSLQIRFLGEALVTPSV